MNNTVKLRLTIEVPDEPAELARYYDALTAMRRELPERHPLLYLTLPLVKRLAKRLEGKG
jgi:hypothetical protein